MQNTLYQVEKFEILNKRSNILCKVETYFDTYLNLSSKNVSNDKPIQEILFNIDVIEVDYYWALSILSERDYFVHLNRSLCSCFVNN